jgi:hypothetical protein
MPTPTINLQDSFTGTQNVTWSISDGPPNGTYDYQFTDAAGVYASGAGNLNGAGAATVVTTLGEPERPSRNFQLSVSLYQSGILTNNLGDSISYISPTPVVRTAPITFTLYNSSSTSATVNDFTFNTAPNILHLSTLTDFGVGGVFTGTYTVSGATIPPMGSLSLTQHYSTQSGLALAYADYISTVAINSTLSGSPVISTITNYVTFSATPLDPPWKRPPIEGTGGSGVGGGGGGWDIIPLLVLVVFGVGECFTAGTQVSMADGSTKNIEDVAVGDRVYNHDCSQINTVKFLEHAIDSHWGELYSPTSELEPFATINHPLYINGQLSSVHPDQHYELYPWLGRAGKLNPSKIIPAQGKTVYNLWVDGDHTYVVNGYGTPSIIDDGDFLRQAAEYGYISHAQTMQILHDHSNNGNALRVGSYHVNKLLSWLDLKPLSKIVANSLSGPTRPLKQILWAVMRAVGVIANLVYKTRN